MELKNSQTKIILMRAFAGECQAQNRYLIAADTAKQQKLNVIERLFRFTALQEHQHARIFQELLGECAGESVEITADFPVDVSGDIQQLLDLAARDEKHEAETVYPEFARIAAEEGFLPAAEKLRAIAEIEETHRQRFERFAQLWREGMLFRSDSTEQQWVCLNCGHIHTGSEPPSECPVCSFPQGYSIRREDTWKML
ncbi:MAG: rubrerythrin family protein [Ruminococcus sp.]|nr:rubrerythrin family protein [Ruminococcus sp.]